MNASVRVPAVAEPYREPPSNLDAEQALLGALILNNAVHDVIGGSVSTEDFFHEAHRRIFDVATMLISSGQAATPATLKTFLGEVEVKLGTTMPAYLASLCSNAVPPILAQDYASVVRDLSTRRKMIQAVEEVAEQAYDMPANVKPAQIAGEAIAALHAIAGQHGARSTRRDAHKSVAKAIEHIHAVKGGEERHKCISTGFPDLDLATEGYQPGTLWIVAARPGMGKTIYAATSGNKVAKSGHGAMLFSLEVPEEQMIARLMADLSFDRRQPISFKSIMAGTVDDTALWLLEDAHERFSKMPLVLDVASRLTPAEIRVRVRAEKERMASKGMSLKVVFIDYLKQIQASDRYRGNKVYEIGEISYSLKQLAKDEGICVVLLAQLNRGLEGRDDKRPGLADLRECVVGSTLLTDALTGHRVPIRDVAAGQKVLAMDDNEHIRPFAVEQVWSTGVKPTFRLRTRTGREIVATGNHPLYTPCGWRRLDEIAVGSEVATSMRLPEHGGQSAVSPDLCRLLGYMVGDGTYQHHRSVGFISCDPDTFTDVSRIIAANFPTVSMTLKAPKGDWQEADFVYTDKNGFGRPHGNQLREWIREVGIFGQKDSTKRAPRCAFETRANAANFIAGYLSSDGCVKRTAKHKRPVVWEIHFDSVSRDLLLDVQALLTRFGVVGCINDGYTSKKATKPIYRLNVAPSADNLARFAEAIPVVGRKGALLAEMLGTLARTRTSADVFALPSIVSELVGTLAPRRCLGARNGPKVRSGWNDLGKRMRRDVCEAWAERLGNEELRRWASSDLLWERVVSIESAGDQEVFDISVPGAANFLANGILAHNSGDLENDADIVAFVHREAYYIQRSPEYRAGDIDAQARFHDSEHKAELILGKNRIGPTKTIDLWCDVACSTMSGIASGVQTA